MRRRKASKSEEAVDMITTTIALDAETHRRLRLLAVEERTTFRDLVRTAVTEYMERRTKRERP